jgi:hypothetical protein
MTHTGGCLCGAVRFEVAAEPTASGYCHCRICQRSTGAPLLAWISFPLDAMRYTSGQPKRYLSSAQGTREFCAECGTQIAFRQIDGGTTAEINTGAMDDPDAYPPREHIWCESALTWLNIQDDLPRYPRGAPTAGSAK